MSQVLILDALKTYLALTAKNHIASLDEQKALLWNPFAIRKIEESKKAYLEHHQKLLKQLEAGHCFGLAVCDAAMDYVGKGHWWEQALVQAVNWDDTESALDEVIRVPYNSKKSSPPTTRRAVFERLLNYTLFNHTVMPDLMLGMTEIHQGNLLQPDAWVLPADKTHPEQALSYFELVDRDGKIRHIKQNVRIVGYLTKEDLLAMLDGDQIRHTICLAHNDTHAIRLDYDGTNWILYDPNYDHFFHAPMHKKGSKEEIIAEIFSILGHAIVIEVASLNKKRKISFSGYDELLKNSPEPLLQGVGLHAIAKHTPENLLRLLKSIDGSPRGLALKAIIVTAFSQTTHGGWGLLHTIAKYAPAALPELLKLADTSTEGLAIQSALESALAAKTIHGWTGLHVVAFEAPDALPALIKVALRGSDKAAALDSILQALATSHNKELTGWKMIEKKVLPEQRKEIVAALLNAIESLNAKSLLELKENLQDALTNKEAKYRGLCKQATLSLFFKEGSYGHTSIWVMLFDKTEEVLKNKVSNENVKTPAV